MTDYIATTPTTFFTFYTQARAEHQRIREATSPTSELAERHPHASWFVAVDHASGFGVDPDGTLLGVFSTVKGRGEALLAPSGAAPRGCGASMAISAGCTSARASRS